jgi:hypothetical protein
MILWGSIYGEWRPVKNAITWRLIVSKEEEPIIMARMKRGAIANPGPVAPKQQATNKTSNKSAFVRDLPRHMPAKEVVAKAKARGMRITIAYVYSIRTAARVAAEKRSGERAPGPRNARAEDLLRAVAAELGLSRAIAILEGEKAKVAELLGAR